MPDNNFGINLSLEEKQFIHQYCDLLLQYGSSSFFPMTDELKKEQYKKLMEIVGKLTLEEAKQFNEFTDKSQTLHLDNSLENDDKPKVM